MNCGCNYSTAAYIKSLTIPKRVQKLPDWSYYKFRYMNPTATLGERLKAMKIYLEYKKIGN